MNNFFVEPKGDDKLNSIPVDPDNWLEAEKPEIPLSFENSWGNLPPKVWKFLPITSAEEQVLPEKKLFSEIYPVIRAFPEPIPSEIVGGQPFIALRVHYSLKDLVKDLFEDI